MNFTDEMINKAKTATSTAELQAMAKEHNIELSESEASEYFDFLNGNRKVNKDGLQELSSVELEMVAGGKEAMDPDPKYQVGQHLWLGQIFTLSYQEVVVVEAEFYNKENNSWCYVVNPVGFDYNKREYLESREHVHTSDPGPIWKG